MKDRPTTTETPAAATATAPPASDKPNALIANAIERISLLLGSDAELEAIVQKLRNL